MRGAAKHLSLGPEDEAHSRSFAVAVAGVPAVPSMAAPDSSFAPVAADAGDAAAAAAVDVAAAVASMAVPSVSVAAVVVAVLTSAIAFPSLFLHWVRCSSTVCHRHYCLKQGHRSCWAW